MSGTDTVSAAYTVADGVRKVRDVYRLDDAYRSRWTSVLSTRSRSNIACSSAAPRHILHTCTQYFDLYRIDKLYALHFCTQLREDSSLYIVFFPLCSIRRLWSEKVVGTLALSLPPVVPSGSASLAETRSIVLCARTCPSPDRKKALRTISFGINCSTVSLYWEQGDFVGTKRCETQF